MKPTYAVLKEGTISGPWTRMQIIRGIRQGRFQPEDSYRRKDKDPWQPIALLWKKEKRTNVIFLSVSGIMILLIGLYVAHTGLHLIGVAKASPSWPSVPGKITYAKVENSSNGIIPVIWYRYDIGSKKFFGDGIFPGCGIGSKPWAQSIIDRHPAGSNCRVFYRPDNVHVTMLEPGVSPHTFVIFALGCLIIYFGALVMWATFIELSWIIPRPTDPRPTLWASGLRIGAALLPFILGIILIRWFL